MTSERKRGRPKKSPDSSSALTAKQLTAINAEVLRRKKGEQLLFHRPAERVATEAAVSKRSVQQWRKQDAYKNGVYSALLMKRFQEPEKKELEKAASDIETPGGIGTGRYIIRNWKGPTRSLIDGKLYNTPEDYTQHLAYRKNKKGKLVRRQEKLFPIDLISKTRAKK